MLGQGCLQGVHRPGQITHSNPCACQIAKEELGRNTEGVKRQDNAGGDTAEHSELPWEAAALFELIMIMRAVSFPFSKLVCSLLQMITDN